MCGIYILGSSSSIRTAAWEADLKDDESETTLEAVRRQVAADIEATQATVSLHQLRLAVRTIQGYDAPSKKTVTEVSWWQTRILCAGQEGQAC